MSQNEFCMQCAGKIIEPKGDRQPEQCPEGPDTAYWPCERWEELCDVWSKAAWYLRKMGYPESWFERDEGGEPQLFTAAGPLLIGAAVMAATIGLADDDPIRDWFVPHLFEMIPTEYRGWGEWRVFGIPTTPRRWRPTQIRLTRDEMFEAEAWNLWCGTKWRFGYVIRDTEDGCWRAKLMDRSWESMGDYPLAKGKYPKFPTRRAAIDRCIERQFPEGTVELAERWRDE